MIELWPTRASILYDAAGPTAGGEGAVRAAGALTRARKT